MGLLPAAGAQPASGGASPWQPVPHQAGSGQVWMQRAAGRGGARQQAQQALQGLGALLDRPPRLLGGMVNREDNGALLSFAGHARGALVQGYLVVQGGTVAAVLDEPARLARSGPQLLAAVDAAAGGGRAAGPSPYAKLQWQRVPFGSGALELPVGWQVVGAHQGAVDVVGTQGEVISLGAAAQVMTPQAAQQFSAMGMPVQMFVAPASPDPMAAFQNVQPQIERFNLSRGGPVVRLTRVREAERVSFGAGMAAALIASDGIGSMGQRPYKKLSLVAAGGVMANGNWLYYTSEVYAPAELYPHALPVMLKVWNSWTVDKSVLMERVVSAAKSMRETQDILNSVHAGQQASQDRLSTAWGHHLRGTVVVANTDTGRASTEWLYQPGPAAGGIGTEHNRHMTNVLRDANQAAGYERWQMLNP